MNAFVERTKGIQIYRFMYFISLSIYYTNVSVCSSWGPQGMESILHTIHIPPRGLGERRGRGLQGVYLTKGRNRDGQLQCNSDVSALGIGLVGFLDTNEDRPQGESEVKLKGPVLSLRAWS